MSIYWVGDQGWRCDLCGQEWHHSELLLDEEPHNCKPVTRDTDEHTEGR
jgi:hypothetical protein